MEIPSVTAEGIGGTIAAVIAGIVGARRLFSTVKVRSAEDETTIAAINAQNVIIDNLKSELERMAESFGRVLAELEKSHQDNVNLRTVNLSLQDKISQLNENLNQTKEKLNSFSRFRQQCGGCKFEEPSATEVRSG